jgi:hypothetical protein
MLLLRCAEAALTLLDARKISELSEKAKPVENLLDLNPAFLASIEAAES